MEAPKVTECWTWAEVDSGKPSPDSVSTIRCARDKAAVIMWREDYDAMRKELEELEHVKAQYERLLNAYAAEKLLNGKPAGKALGIATLIANGKGKKWG